MVVILFIAWALGFFWYNLDKSIHILPVIALLALSFRKNKRKSF
jgi:hypothetical protein